MAYGSCEMDLVNQRREESEMCQGYKCQGQPAGVNTGISINNQIHVDFSEEILSVHWRRVVKAEIAYEHALGEKTPVRIERTLT